MLSPVCLNLLIILCTTRLFYEYNSFLRHKSINNKLIEYFLSYDIFQNYCCLKTNMDKIIMLSSNYCFIQILSPRNLSLDTLKVSMPFDYTATYSGSDTQDINQINYHSEKIDNRPKSSVRGFVSQSEVNREKRIFHKTSSIFQM